MHHATVVLLCLLGTACSFLSRAQSPASWEATTSYYVRYNVPEIENNQVRGYFNHISNTEITHSELGTHALVTHLYEVLAKNAQPSFGQSELGDIDYGRTISDAEARATLVDTIVQWVEDPETGEMIETLYANDRPREDCAGFTTEFDVYYDAKNNRCVVTPWMLAPYFKVYNMDADELKGYRAYAYPTTQNGAVPATSLQEVTPKSDLHNPNYLWGERMLMSGYSNVKGEFTFARMHSAQPLKQLYNTNLQSYLFAQVASGELKAYGDENCTKALNKDELKAACTNSYELWVEDPMSGEAAPIEVEEEIFPADLVALRLNQSWAFDMNDFELNITVNSIGIACNTFDEGTGEILGLKTLFWVKMDN